VLIGYRQQCPMPPPLKDAPAAYAQLMAYTDLHSMKPQLWRWRFDLKTGATREDCLDESFLEFGMLNQRHAGRQNRYAYSVTGKPGWFLFTGLVKHDLATGKTESIDSATTLMEAKRRLRRDWARPSRTTAIW